MREPLRSRPALRSLRAAPARLALALALAALPAAAAPPAAAGADDQGPPARARRLEQLGQFAEAARLYQEAWEATRAPELLYRLGLCRRHLGDYAAAREALRGYLRDAPEGPLRAEAERQLGQLQVLIEERGLHPELAPGPRPARTRAIPPATAAKPPAAAAAPQQAAAPQRQAAATPQQAAAAQQQAAAAPQQAAATAQQAAAAPVRAAEPSAPTAGAAVPAAPVPAPVEPVATPAAFAARALPAAAVGSTSGPSVAAPAALLLPAPGEAAPRVRGPSLRRGLPWFGGAAAAGLAGGLLLWDGGRVSSELDAKFAAGTLTPGDQPRYDRVSRESWGGRLLLLGALGLATAGLLLCW
jgi:tetratricopeptide (TPR) repeat protein